MALSEIHFGGFSMWREEILNSSVTESKMDAALMNSNFLETLQAALSDDASSSGASGSGSSGSDSEGGDTKTIMGVIPKTLSSGSAQDSGEVVVVVEKRNARERRRVQTVNQAFASLRHSIPLQNRKKRVSKVKTLRKAIEYISHLRSLINQQDSDVTQETHLISSSRQHCDHVSPLPHLHQAQHHHQFLYTQQQQQQQHGSQHVITHIGYNTGSSGSAWHQIQCGEQSPPAQGAQSAGDLSPQSFPEYSYKCYGAMVSCRHHDSIAPFYSAPRFSYPAVTTPNSPLEAAR